MSPQVLPLLVNPLPPPFGLLLIAIAYRPHGGALLKSATRVEFLLDFSQQRDWSRPLVRAGLFQSRRESFRESKKTVQSPFKASPEEGLLGVDSRD